MIELRLSCADVRDMIAVPSDPPVRGQVWNIPEVFRLRLKKLLIEAGFDLSRPYLASRGYMRDAFVYQQDGRE